MTLYTETIYHFTCRKCKYWWSIAADKTLESRLDNRVENKLFNNKELYCPWCGHTQTHDSIDMHDNTAPNPLGEYTPEAAGPDTSDD
jgi:hypothetical protein